MNITKMGTSWKGWKGEKTYFFIEFMKSVRKEIRNDMSLKWIQIKVGKPLEKNESEQCVIVCLLV
jgi:hypothetical protein